MRIFKSLFFVLIASTLLTSCSEDDAIPSFSGDVSVTLINKGSTEVIEGESATFIYDIVLSSAFKQDITINFDLEELVNYPNLLSIDPVIIAKNQTKGTLTVTAVKKPDAENVLADNLNLTFAIKDYKGVTNKLYLADNYVIKVKAEEGITPLTADQQDLIKHYQSQGIDISMWIGKIPVQVEVITAPNGLFAPFETSQTLNYTGVTYITLSENATKDKPLLVMSKNALGMSEYLQYVFRNETILNTTDWNEPSQAAMQGVLKALGDERIIKWKNKEYAFNVKVDDLEFKTGGTIDYVRENNTYEIGSDFLDPNSTKTLAAVDFQYEFPLWDELAILANGNDPLKEHIITGGSIHPNFYIGYSTIITDDWYEGDWITPTSSYNETEMNFKFNTDHENSGSYDIVTVKFTQPN
ncbi:DUF4929 family protein [Tenacibaculum finnmarkense]|uniref:DUF4929 family protein n=1 Tax=Tenacibaculum finnmarkense TaxID=2781243 RepID=UPI001E2FD556|nr:DUF4929 family protein [Tenacibaculum finnmarkense]MCD8412473.1 DUF4929 domain-containing protein [Tenacibaculum finnmarkense genomovar ulcerans]MCG8206828.1 DUF4929 family protein [Tenacibaculum finnmarkense genomovar finnmarkense]MCG8722996.1 DUF4929 domain-containing protein [Tenacibaculum finnmarkense]MCG8741262.1 DUF4929 domain-containing protein [Tenacibaculum finnmarkense]MCG8764559.1 DUF4929 domain-containing protein [Tenacibaculum finnmarkense]